MTEKHGALSMSMDGVLLDGLEDRRRRVQFLENRKAAMLASGEEWKSEPALQHARRKLKEAIAEGRP